MSEPDRVPEKPGGSDFPDLRLLELGDDNPEQIHLARIKALRRRALQHLSRREHSREELRRKLLIAPRKRGRAARLGAGQSPNADAPYATEVDQVVAWLIEHDLQSDQRFAESLVRRRGPREGAAKIAQTLKNNRIDPTLCAHMMAELKQTEYDRARAIWARRFSDPPQSWQEKSRQARFLTSRGFCGDVIKRILKAE